ncbi:MAG: efflux RND transporter periplasmic adaptor subunit [Gallionellaceae bacterium]|nr:efflux RND transporter periplasmic adaptor subunit [Gallionellaceae bacterium]MDD5365217.1 efflux RND transporter periplasmic adaptor subunit [Gallionellaceae bacterium]
MNRKILIVPVVLAAVVAAVWWVRRDHAPAAAELVVHGNVDIRQVELAFNASGRIDQVLVQEGDRVSQGQALARLDTARLKLSLAQAEAQANALRSQVIKLKAGNRPEEIRQAAAQRDVAQVAVADAGQVYQRQQDLVARHFVSQQQADSAENSLNSARERLKAAEASYRLAQLGARKEDIAAAAASLAAQEAAVAGLRHDIAEGELLAPDGGVIENRILEPGDMASPQKSVLTLALTDPMWVRVYLPENVLGRIPAGARATVTTDSHPDRKYAAWVGYVSPAAEFTPKTVETAELRTSLVYQARVFVCNGAGELRQGMPTTVTIAFDQPAGQGAPCGGGK